MALHGRLESLNGDDGGFRKRVGGPRLHRAGSHRSYLQKCLGPGGKYHSLLEFLWRGLKESQYSVIWVEGATAVMFLVVRFISWGPTG